MIKHLTLKEFKEQIFDFEKNSEKWEYKGTKPAIIDWYASWCGPCKMIAPILEEISKEYEDKIDVFKIDVDAEQELAAAFGIRSIPSLLFIPMNDQPQMSVGGMSKTQITDIIKDFLKI